MFIMNANGTGQTQLLPFGGFGLGWQSLPRVTVVPACAAEGATATVTVTTSGGTATSGVDYQPTEVTWTFPPLSTTVVLDVPIVADTTPEPDETIDVTLTAPVNATIADGRGTTTILDNDT
jgi:chitinase